MSEIPANVPAYFIRAVTRFAREQNEGWRELVERCGLSAAKLETDFSGDDIALPMTIFADLQTAIIKLLDDEQLGYAKRPLPNGSLRLFCHACRTAETLGGALTIYCDFFNLLGLGLHYKLQQIEQQTVIQLHAEAGFVPEHYLFENNLYRTHRFSNWLVGKFLPLTAVNLAYPEPAHAADYSKLFPDTDILFGQQHCALILPAEYLTLSVQQSQQSLQAFMKDPLYELLCQKFSYQTWTHRVQQQLRQPAGLSLDLEAIAEALTIHPQTLRRRLQEEDLSFREIKNNLRRDIAINCLSQDSLPVDEIAQKCGFSDASVFVRTFKKWTGKTPNAYRNSFDKSS